MGQRAKALQVANGYEGKSEESPYTGGQNPEPGRNPELEVLFVFSYFKNDSHMDKKWAFIDKY